MKAKPFKKFLASLPDASPRFKPCKYYKKYKAVYRPKCKCLPCAFKYYMKHEWSRPC